MPSLQAELERALSTLLQADVTCHGCGRTDAGVHASQYIVHFNVDSKWNIDLIYRLNKFLPDDIMVYDVEYDLKQGRLRLRNQIPFEL